MFVKLLLFSLIFLLLAIVFLGIRIFFTRKGRFPETHVGHNPEMRKRGIGCAQKTDTGCNPLITAGGCDACETD